MYTNWKNVCADAASHEGVQYHKDAVAKMTAFLNTDQTPSQRIDAIQSRSAAELASKNRAILTPVLRCLDLAGRQELALRGHRDDFGTTESPQGNFMALVRFAVESGDKGLQDHLERCPRNATCMSKTVQNELLRCMADELVCKIVEEIHASHYFAVQADEVTDVSPFAMSRKISLWKSWCSLSRVSL